LEGRNAFFLKALAYILHGRITSSYVFPGPEMLVHLVIRQMDFRIEPPFPH
jgi:hypothetical protein